MIGLALDLSLIRIGFRQLRRAAGSRQRAGGMFDSLCLSSFIRHSLTDVRAHVIAAYHLNICVPSSPVDVARDWAAL